ncbi:hypothetical protein [Pseudomonas soli]|uniref:Uncharacterized protein n=1 Tax=Pseudomonas soli TaxID=1306993 RepID=A0AAJ5SS88_9PSED|nr:hypothetical protein [Pseudomonas soli]UXZ44512.1 hypothetical protein K7K07_20925 [Pseudomonas soli]
MNKPVWFCQEFGTDGMVVINAEVDLGPGAGVVGYSRYLHPFELDNAVDPQGMFGLIISDMSAVMGRLTAPTQPESRACAFGQHDEAASA